MILQRGDEEDSDAQGNGGLGVLEIERVCLRWDWIPRAALVPRAALSLLAPRLWRAGIPPGGGDVAFAKLCKFPVACLVDPAGALRSLARLPFYGEAGDLYGIGGKNTY